MEVNEQNGFLEELLALRNPTQQQDMNTMTMTDIFATNNDYFALDSLTTLFDQIQNPSSSPSFIDTFYTTTEPLPCHGHGTFSHPPPPPPPHGAAAAIGGGFQLQEAQSMSLLYEEELGFLGEEVQQQGQQSSCKVEPNSTTQCSNMSSPEEMSNKVFNIGHFMPMMERKVNGKAKRLQGQPSKNLMAERRRRKRLNDRLSMLRSIVPKISKMDRTSILGDTIDYMKDLLDKIDALRRDIAAVPGDPSAEIGLFKEVKPNEVLVRNSPKFEVERRDLKTKIEICCAGKPGLLYSTVTALEAVGLEIQHCVISCFNDFAMQASCSEGPEKRAAIGCEEVKQALFRNAGYGGRCL